MPRWHLELQPPSQRHVFAARRRRSLALNAKCMARQGRQTPARQPYSSKYNVVTSRALRETHRCVLNPGTSRQGHKTRPTEARLEPPTSRQPNPQMAQYGFTMNRVGKIVPPKRQILKDISLSFFPGAKIGLLGLNGSGKSTLIRIMAGVDKEIEGEATPMPNLNIGYLPQEPQLDPQQTVREAVEDGLGEVFSAQKKLDAIYAAYAEPDADFDALAAEQAKYEAILATSDGGTPEQQLEVAADALRLPAWDAKIEHLSGGEKRRVALCKLLLQKPDMLLLDEPTNHLDAESVDWLEHTLHDYAGTVMVVTHDRYFLDNVTSWMLELERGRGYPFEGNYSSWLEQKRKRLQQEEKEESARQRALAMEQEWIAASPRARQAKNRARIQRYEELLAKSQEQVAGIAEITLTPGPRL